MKVNYNNQQNFKGYDARPLKGLFVTDKACAEQLRKITHNIGIDIFTPEIASKSIRKEYTQLMSNNNLLWAQDYFTFMKDNVIFDGTRDFAKRVLRASADGIKKRLGFVPLKSDPHIRGGNLFICNVNGERKIIISNDKILPQESFYYPIPKLDYHIDLFIRPLDNGRVLVADNKSTTDSLHKLAQNYEKYIKENNLNNTEIQTYKNIIRKIENALSCMETTEKYDKRNPTETIEKLTNTLKNYGFKPIKVPACYYYLKGVKNPEQAKQLMNNFERNMKHLEENTKNSPIAEAFTRQFIALERWKTSQDKTIGVQLENFYLNNFINAIVLKDKNNKIHYITNAPLLDRNELGITPEIEAKTGLSTKNMFIESISPYVNKENIHFIDETTTEKLFKYMGGIHCSAAEIPE